MKRTLACSLLLVLLAAAGLGYLAYAALAAESLRLEERLRQAEAKGAAPLVFRVGELFAQLEREFLAQVDRQQGLPTRETLARAAHALPLVAEPYARRDGRVLLCTEPGGKQQQLSQHARFLANQEKIRYVQRNWNAAQQGQSRQQEQTTQQVDQPQQMAAGQQWNIEYARAGNWLAATSSFNEIVRDRESLFIPRFIDNELEILYWRRAGAAQQSGFGFAIEMRALRRRLATLAEAQPRSQGLVTAILDDKGQLVGSNRPGVRLAGKPFLILELHEKLPHWTLASYWVDPARLDSLVRARRWTIGLVLGGCAVTLLGGLLLLAREARRDAQLLRKQADFVSNVSHELKTPLTSIQMYAELIERRFGELPKAREYSGVIQAECARLARLVGRVLDFSRSERGKQEFRLLRCDLRDVVRAVTGEHALRYEPEGWRLELALPEQPVEAAVDADAIGQLLSNLLSNARKYGSPEDRRIGVELAAGARGVELRVRDHGAGVPRRWRRRIFDPFVRIDNSLAAQTQGSGIGLALARRIARAHGGELVVTDPADGPGALFVFRLPEQRDG